MYDILQLNDMLVPELLDIAEQLKILNAKKLDKQELIYKILDKQAVIASAVKGGPPEDKGKRKRIIKTTTSNATEEADIMSMGEDKNRKEIRKEAPKKKIVEKAAPVKRGRKKADEDEDNEMQSRAEHTEDREDREDREEREEREDREDREDREEQAEREEQGGNVSDQDDSEEQQSQQGQESEQSQETTPSSGMDAQHKAYPHRRESVFNIEFDGVIMAEGVLEMMPQRRRKIFRAAESRNHKW